MRKRVWKERILNMLPRQQTKIHNHDRQKITLPRIRTRCSCVLRVPERALDIGPPQRLLVYTAYDTEADFGALNTYYLPDSILLIGAADKTEYWKDDNALEIVNTVAGRMNAAGYTRTDDKEAANVGLQLSYVQKVTYFVGYDYPYWWWYYPYYWTPGYWGDWLGWHYPYRVYYGYTAGSLLIEMLDLQADQQSGKKLPVIWDSYIGGSAHLVGKPQPAAHAGRRRTGIRPVALPEKIM